MIRINLSRINWLQVGSYVVIAILTLLLFRNCEENKDLKLAKYSFEQEIKISQLQVDKYANQVNLLNDKITTLETTKTKEKVKIVTVIKEVEKKIDAVGNLTTKGIANFYQERYKLPIVITKYGVSLSDTIAKKNIVELIQKDGLVLELNHTKNILNIAENQSKIKDEVIVLKDSIITEKGKQIDSHIEIEKNLTKSVKSERVKKTVWQVITAGFAIGAGVLLIR